MIYASKIIARKEIAENTLEVFFLYPRGFSFKAGQYIQLSVPELLYPDHKGAYRVFSIASSPLDQERISIIFRDTDSGFKRTLKELPINTSVNIEGPHGFFTIPQTVTSPIVLVAGGVGVTPFLSMIRFAAEKNLTLPITLLYANTNKESAIYFKELHEMAVSNKYFSLKNMFGRINEQFLRQNIQSPQNHTWYIAGPPDMVDVTRNILLLLGVREELILYEEFSGY